MNTEKMKQLISITEKLLNQIEANSFWSSFQSIDLSEGLEATHKKLTSRNYSVAVIAAMKAGKSTLFNALLGHDMLPNETAACTAAKTEIKFSPIPSRAIKKIMKNGTIYTINAGGGHTLEQNFHNDVRSSRNQDGVTEIEKYYLEFPIVALADQQYDGLVENFILVDTPGPNEASTGLFNTDALKETTYYQLRNADAIIFVLDYGVYKSDTNANLIKEIFAGREDIKQDQDKLFFVINKIDTRTSKDGSKADIIQAVQNMITHQTRDTLSQPQVLPLSSLMALYARMISSEKITAEAMQDCKNKYQSQYSNEVVINGKKYLEQLENQELAARMLAESGIQELEEKVLLDTFRKASNKLIVGAKLNLEQKCSFMLKTLESHVQVQNKGIDELRVGITLSKQEIESLQSMAEQMNEHVSEHLELLYKDMNSMIVNINTDIDFAVNGQLGKFQNVYKSEDRGYLTHLQNQIERDSNNTISAYCLRKQDEILRKYTSARSDLDRTIYQGFKMLSERADAIIKKNLDMEIESGGLISLEPGELTVDYTQVISKSSNQSTELSDEDFRRQSIRGAKTASTAAVVGMTVGGPVGALVGALAGFVLGIGTYNSNNSAAPRKTIYTLDVTEMKEVIRTNASNQSRKIKEEFNSQVQKEMNNIRLMISKNVLQFLEQINSYLDDIEQDYKQKRSEREAYVAQLTGLINEVTAIREELNEI